MCRQRDCLCRQNLTIFPLNSIIFDHVLQILVQISKCAARKPIVQASSLPRLQYFQAMLQKSKFIRLLKLIACLQVACHLLYKLNQDNVLFIKTIKVNLVYKIMDQTFLAFLFSTTQTNIQKNEIQMNNVRKHDNCI